MVDHPATDGALDRARALASPVRARIHEIVSESSLPVTVGDLVEATGLHRSAVRLHLRQLAGAHLVHEFTLPPEGRGRPRLAYRAIDEDPYRTVVTWFASSMSGSDAVTVGRTVASTLATSPGDRKSTRLNSSHT